MLDIQVTPQAELTVMQLHGALDKPASRRLAQALVGAIDGGARRLVIDLGGVPYVSSAALGVLYDAHRRLGARGRIVLCGPSADVRRLIVFTGLDRLLTLYPDRAGAEAALIEHARHGAAA